TSLALAPERSAMSRFAFGPGRRRNGSRHTARTGRWPQAVRGTATPALLPDGASQLSDGIVVETRLTARLLGVRLLRVDGIVLMSPARLSGPPPAASPRVRATDARAGQNGHLLAQAAQLLQENEAHLRRFR
ncbi:MAG TPA: hypothetical protein VNQ53_19235, partial [Nocardioides sp.]|nr:hypothetical protein [Nocardioides sp.]